MTLVVTASRKSKNPTVLAQRVHCTS